MTSRIVFIILVLLAAAGAMAFRLPGLDVRPMHCDEAVHAAKLGELLEEGVYTYDPNDFHGPTLNYFTLIPARLSGVKRHAELQEWHLRVVPAAFGVGLVLLVLLMGDGLGRPAAVCAAVLTAISPAFVYYSRYYIQEVLLVFFTFVLIVGLWRYARGGGVGWCVLAGAGLGLMHATKETWVIAGAAMAGALALTAAWEKWVARRPLPLAERAWNWRIAVGLAAAVIVAVALLSSFFANASGPWDSIRTYIRCFRRGTGGEGALHVNPWQFYLRILLWYHEARGPVWTEGLIVALAVAGAAAVFLNTGAAGATGAAGRGRGLGSTSPALVRFLAFYTALTTLIYTLIPYKTPWCLLTFLHGMILLAGVGAAAIIRWVRWLPLRIVGGLALAGLAAQLGFQAYRTSFRFSYDQRNPYVYAHSQMGVVRLGRRAEQIAALIPPGKTMLIRVITPDAHDIWPIPWYLRRLDKAQIRYRANVPDDADGSMLIFTLDVEDRLRERLRLKYQYEHYGLRPNVLLMAAIRADLWQRYIDALKAAQAAKEGAAAVFDPQAQSRIAPTQPAAAAASLPSTRSAAVMAEPVPHAHRFAHAAMGAVFEAFIPHGDADYARSAAQAAFEELDRIEKELSRFVSSSDVSRINAAPAGQAVRVGLEVEECLLLARRMWQETGGAFDITAGALYRPQVGSESPLAEGPRVGMDLLAIDAEEHTVTRRDDRLRIDLGGIGKGYVLDKMAEVLRDWGIGSALLNAGTSTVLAVGAPPGREGWRLALRDPVDPDGAPLGRLVLKDAALSGSGTSLKSHIIDPRTGRPVPADRSAWSVAPTGGQADALSTAFCVMEMGQIRKYAHSRRDVTAVIGRRQGDRWRLQEFGRAVIRPVNADLSRD